MFAMKAAMLFVIAGDEITNSKIKISPCTQLQNLLSGSDPGYTTGSLKKKPVLQKHLP
jgi:hypothetical protein